MGKKISVIFLFLLGLGLTVQSGDLVGFNPEIIDTTINPGENFYSYASGLWLKNESLPDGYGRFGYYNLADQKIESELIGLINGTTQYDPGNHLAHLITSLYQTGMDSVGLNSAGLEAIASELELIDNAKTMTDLQQVITKLILIGIDPFFELYRPKPWQILDTNYLCFTQSRLGLTNISDYLTDTDDPNSRRNKYKLFIVDLMSLVISDKEKLNVFANDVISLETELASKMMSPTALRDFDKTYNLYKIKKLKSLIPQFDWELFFDELGMTGTNKAVIGQPKYFKEVGKIFKRYDIESIKSYLKYLLIYRSSSMLDSEIARVFWDYKINVCGWQKISREIFIFDIINSEMPDALGTLYIEKYFPSDKKNKVLNLITNLKTAFKNRIQNNKWISEVSRSSILRKLDYMNFLIGGPELYVDYDNFNFKDSVFIQNLFAVREYSNRRHIAKMGTAKDKKAWSVNPHSTNAWYGPNSNNVTLPAGNISEFWSDNDDAWNYGTVGATIAHEMTHGFDVSGRKYDETGNSVGFWKRVKGWWDGDDDHFEECSTLLKKRYNEFVVLDSYFVNGENTLNENLADLGGLNIAYDAYILSHNGLEPDTIDGFSGPQRFFLSYAQKWRELFDEKTLIGSLDGYHAPPQYRTNGVIFNVSGFYEAFDINKSDKLYQHPENRITIW